MEILFRCPPELEGLLPRPFPAVEGLPEWYKAMPPKAFSEVLGKEKLTVKKCPPFIDAMTYGFLVPLATDLRIEDGAFEWDWPVPGAQLSNYTRAPIDFHDNSQVVGSPFFEADRFLIKFVNFWTIELPPGFSLLVTHPVNRPDLPFLTLTGLVDSDLYKDNFVNFPARWLEPDFKGTLPRGTPVAQCIPLARASFELRFDTIGAAAAARLRTTRKAVEDERDTYRRQFRARKR